MCEDDGILGSDGIELLAIGESFLRPKSVIPATAGDPFACFVLRNGGGNALLHFFRGKPARQRDGKFVGGGATEMDVRIVEAGHHKLSFELDRLHAFLAASAIEEAVVHFADATDLSVADRHGLGKMDHVLLDCGGGQEGVETVQLKGQFVMPGFNDAHVHLGGAAADELAVPLTGVPSPEEMQKRIAPAVAQHKPGEWITAASWVHTLFPEKRFPNRQQLDAVAPKNPVI